ncbi:MAG: ATP-binding cassette domain-containing protein [Mycoplasma sp.]|nr:ATP-binding cassette domain-containing protein [Mycoplasma sp.]
MNKKILEVENLNKVFKNKWGYVRAIDDVSFDLHKGEVIGLIGESGSGKTTIGRALIRLIPGSSGIVRLDNEVISGKKLPKQSNRFLRKNMQMIFQDPHASLNPQKNVFSILEEPLKVNGIIKKELKELLKNKDIIRENFRLTFKIKNLEFELEANKKYLEIIKQKNNKINDDFSKINIEDYDNPLECFDIINHSYWSYYFALKHIKISFFNERTNKLIETFKNEKNNYKNGKIDEDELKLKESKKEYKLAILKSKMSNESAQAIINKPILKKEYQKTIYLKKSDKKTTKLLIESIINEHKNKYKHYFSNSINIVDQKEYNYFINLSKTNKFVYQELFKRKIWLKHIKKDTFIELKNNINILITKNLNNPEKIKEPLIKKIKEIINISINNEKEFKNNIQDKKIILLKNKEKINLKSKPAITLKELINYEKKLEEAKKINQKEISNFEIQANKKIHLIKKELNKINKNIEDEEFILEQELYNKYFDSYKLFQLKIKEYSENKIKKFKYKEKDPKWYQLSKKQKEKISNYKQFPYKLKEKFDFQKSTKLAFIDDEKQSLKELSFANILLGQEKSWFETYKIKKLIIRQKVFSTLKEVGLNREHAYRYPHAFSGGQRQRVAIGRALISKPKVIIADEPIASLDISIQAQIVNLLKNLAKNKGIGIIFIAHDLSMVEYIADKTIILHLGRIVEMGGKNLYDKPIHPYTKNLFEAIPKLSNANQKFLIKDFSSDYLKNYSFLNKPLLKEVNKEHFVLGTSEQLKKWTK